MSTELLTTAVDCFWLFFCGVLVFFMQTGFTMVEAGFTRSKNTGNIIMKNIVDFMFGSIIYWFIGYGLMYGAVRDGAVSAHLLYEQPEQLQRDLPSDAGKTYLHGAYGRCGLYGPSDHLAV